MFQRAEVSVLMITFGHEKFIEDAVNGVLMQECNFEIDLILVNDCSPDTTNKLIMHIIETHPRSHRIKYTMHPKNKGMTPNFIWALQQCKGNYIAWCDGDDYWTDPLKLQKQVDFLENNPDFVLSFHDAKTFDANKTLIKKSWLPKSSKTVIEQEDLKKAPFILPVTMCFKNVIKDFPSEFYKVINADKFLISMLGNYGKAAFTPGIEPSVYRIHEGGIVSSKSAFEKEINHLGTFFYLSKYYRRIDQTPTATYFNEKFEKLYISLMDNSIKNREKLRLFETLINLQKYKASFWFTSYIFLDHISGKGNFLRRLFLSKLY